MNENCKDCIYIEKRGDLYYCCSYKYCQYSFGKEKLLTFNDRLDPCGNYKALTPLEKLSERYFENNKVRKVE